MIFPTRFLVKKKIKNKKRDKTCFVHHSLEYHLPHQRRAICAWSCGARQRLKGAGGRLLTMSYIIPIK